MEPTLKQLKYLLAIRSEESFSRAADRCFVTQSTLSAGIKELEVIIGHTLVNRNKRQATLTAIGNDIAHIADNIQHQIDTITAQAKQASKPLSGPLRLGVIPTIAPYILPNLLPVISEKHPDMELQIHEDLSGRLVEKLEKSHIDMVLLALPYKTPGMEQHLLFKENFVIACATTHTSPRKPTIENLETDKLLLLEDGHCLRDHALSACKVDAQDTKNRKTFSATSLSTLIQMVGHGYGITLLPEMAVRNAHLPETVKTIEFKSPKPSREIGLAWRKNSPRQEEFMLLLRTIELAIKG